MPETTGERPDVTARHPWVAFLVGPWGSLSLLFAGLLLGRYAPDLVSPFSTGFGWFVKGLVAAAPYVILLTLTPALLGLIGVGAGRLALTVTGLFLATSVIGGVFGILAVWPIFQLPWQGAAAGAGVFGVLADIASNLRSSPPIFAVVYSFVVAIALRVLLLLPVGAVRYAARSTTDVLLWVGSDGIGHVGRAFTRVLPLLLFSVGTFVPAGAAAAAAQARDAAAGTAEFNALGWYLGAAALMGALGLVWLLALSILAMRVTGTPVTRIAREYIAPTFTFAWASASSAATIPVNLAAAQAMGVRREVRDFVIPLGATVNLDGAMIGAMILTPVAGKAVGIEIGVADLWATLIPLLLLTAGAPGLPAGIGLVAPPVISAVLGLTGDVQAAFIGVWFAFNVGINDQFRTAVSSCDNGLIALLAQHWAHPGRSVVAGRVVLEELEDDHGAARRGSRA